MKKNIAIICLLISYVNSFSADYYVSSIGDDTKTGTSISDAWSTIAKVISYASTPGFTEGDNIYFEGGKTFSTTASIFLQCDISNGTSTNPLNFNSYGIGKAKLKAKGCTLFNIWAPTSWNVKLGIEIKNLILEGDSLPRIGPKSANGITIWNSSSTVLDYLLIENVEICGFAGDGIAIGRDNGKGRFTNVTIKDVVSHHNPGAIGVAPHSGSGIIIAGADSALIEHCIAHNNGISNNNDGGPIGIWFWDCINSTIQYCESYENKTTNGDGGGFDLDGGCQNCIIQYCYSHDNYGAGYLLAQFSGANSYGSFSGNVIRYNISQNDGRKGNYCGIYFWGANSTDKIGVNYIYNNTVYTGGTPVSGKPACIGFLGSEMSGVKVWNNIFMASNNCNIINSSTAFSTSKVLFQNNVYYADATSTFNIKWLKTYNSLSSWITSSSGQEMNGAESLGLQTNPMFIDAGNGQTINNTYALNSLQSYQLSASSPLIDAGSNLLLPPYSLASIGQYDYYQHLIPVGGKYDFGAYDTTVIKTNINDMEYDNKCDIFIPNPVTSDWININSNIDIQSITLLSIEGQVIAKQTYQNLKQIEFLHYLTPGIYLIRIETVNGIYTRKIIIAGTK